MNSFNGKIRVLLVDDHAVVREGFKLLISLAEDINVVDEASSAEEVIRKYDSVKFDVVMIDISMPNISGIYVIERIINKNPKAKILTVSMHDNILFVEQALKAGSKGYLTKSTAAEEIVNAIRVVAKGEQYLCPEIANKIVFRTSHGACADFSNLSSREFEIFCMYARGMNTHQISEKINLSSKTISNYGTQIKSKLKCHTLADITRLAIKNNILPATEIETP